MAEIFSKISATLKRRRGLIALVVLLASGAVAGFLIWGNRASANDYITAKVDRGNVEVTVSATGTVQAVTTVLVRPAFSGTFWLSDTPNPALGIGTGDTLSRQRRVSGW